MNDREQFEQEIGRKLPKFCPICRQMGFESKEMKLLVSKAFYLDLETGMIHETSSMTNEEELRVICVSCEETLTEQDIKEAQ